MRRDSPRILVVSAHIPYLNATNERFIMELASRSHCILAGYGRKINSRSIGDIKREHGNFDLMFVEPWVLLDRASSILEPYRPVDLFDPTFRFWRMRYSMHVIDLETVKRFRTLNIKVVSTVCSPQFWPERFDEVFNVSPVGALCVRPSLVSDNYVIFPHCLTEDEFRFQNFGRRRFDISVPGVKYSVRAEVARLLEESRTSRVSTRSDVAQRIILRLLNGD